MFAHDLYLFIFNKKERNHKGKKDVKKFYELEDEVAQQEHSNIKYHTSVFSNI